MISENTTHNKLFMENTPNFNQIYNPDKQKELWETPMLFSLDVENTEKVFSMSESGAWGAPS